jgi:flagellar biosynthetic protein FliQ
VSVDQAIALMTGLIEATILVAGPILAAALVGGVLIGIIQTATQINEMSVAYVVKAACVLLVFAIGGTAIAEKAVRYTRTQLTAIGDVVR